MLILLKNRREFCRGTAVIPTIVSAHTRDTRLMKDQKSVDTRLERRSSCALTGKGIVPRPPSADSLPVRCSTQSTAGIVSTARIWVEKTMTPIAPVRPVYTS